METITRLKADCPTIPIVAQSDPDFERLSQCYIRAPHNNSLAVARPKSADEVSSLIRFCTTQSLPFIIRVGGHDSLGRTQSPNGLMIDLREIHYVHVAPDQQTATIGGGCLIGDVLQELEKYGLVTPTGTISTVGYVGWAYMGGYGSLSGVFGLGVDQIVGARVVSAKGEVIEADGELMKGLRGAAGALGAVVEVTIKVYPLKKVRCLLSTSDWLLDIAVAYQVLQVLAGNLIWPTGPDHETFVRSFLERLQGLYAEGMPQALNPLVSIWDNEHFNRCVLLMVTWASDDHEHGHHWINKVAALDPVHPPAVNTIQPCTLLEGLRINDASIAASIYGRCNTITVRGYSPGLVNAVARSTATFAARGSGIALHRFVGHGDGEKERCSVWQPRGEHIMVEILSGTTDEKRVDAAYAWGAAVRRAVVQAVEEKEILHAGWMAMTANEGADLKTLFGQNYEFLMALKKKWDPENAFRNTVPRLLG